MPSEARECHGNSCVGECWRALCEDLAITGISIERTRSRQRHVGYKSDRRTMKAKLLEREGAATYALVFHTDDEVMKGLTRFAAEHRLTAAHFSGLGAFRSVVLGYFEWENKDYKRIPVDEQVEVLSLVGDIALAKGQPMVHAHVVIGKADGTACGGHLLEGCVRPTLEVVLTDSPAHLRRTYDTASGLPLIDLDA